MAKKQKTISKLRQQLDRVFNAYIRSRDLVDGNFTCISCGIVKGKDQMNAGHFWAAGKYTAVRWDEDNVHGQCVSCNCFLHGNLYEYGKRLKAIIGQTRFLVLEKAAYSTFKLDRQWLEERIVYYKDKLNNSPKN